MGLFDFGKPKASAQSSAIKAKLDKDIEAVLKDLRQSRVDKCQNMGIGVTKMGQDLSYIEKKTREYYATVIQEIKGGKTQGQAFQKLMDSASLETDREIIALMFSVRL